MKSHITATNPKGIEFTMTTTMTLSQGELIARRIRSGMDEDGYDHQAAEFCRGISSMVGQVGYKFYPQTGEDE